MKLVLSGVVLSLLLPDHSLAQTSRTRPTPTASTQRVETYEAAIIDTNGSLRITTSDHRNVLVPKEGEQTSFREPRLSSDRSAVGVQAGYRNCCTSYDIPLQLVVYAHGKVHRFTGIGLPILQWHFVEGGRRVAFGQEPVHFGCSIHYELRDVLSERLIDSADIPHQCGQIPDPPAVTIPKWVEDLYEAQKKNE